MKTTLKSGMLCLLPVLTVSFSFAQPKSNFSYTAIGQVISLNNLSSNAISYQWDFGDSTKAVSPNLYHAYKTPGEYEVCLKAIASDTSFDMTCKKISVSADTLVSLCWADSELVQNPAPSSDLFLHTITDSGGNIYVADVPFSRPNAIQLFKYNPNGRLLWSADFQDTTVSFVDVNQMILDSAASIYLACNSGNGSILKYSSRGKFLWRKIFYSASALRLGIDHENNLLVASSDPLYYSIFRIDKYHANGNFVWERKCSVEGNDFPGTVLVDSADNIYMDGQADGTGYDSHSDEVLMKYSREGLLLWQRKETSNLYFTEVGLCFLDPQMNFITTGSLRKYSFEEGYFRKHNSDGTQLWAGYAYDGKFLSGAGDAIGNTYLSSNILWKQGFYAVELKKIGLQGTIEYDSIYNFDSPSAAASCTDQTGNVYAVSSPNGAFILHFGKNGVLRNAVMVSPASTGFFSPSIAQDRYGAIVVSGEVHKNGDVNNIDSVYLVTAKYCINKPDTVIVTGSLKPDPSAISLQVEPNPISESSSIILSLSQSESIQMTLFDINGKQIGYLSHGNFASGKHVIPFLRGRLAEGVYLIKLTTGNTILTKKIIIQ